MATIILPSSLVPFTRNQTRLEITGKTLFSVFINLIRAYPAIRQELFDVRGDLVKAINLYLNNQSVAPHWENIRVQEEDVISLTK